MDGESGIDRRDLACALAAEAAESLEGIASLLQDMAESPGLPHAQRVRLWAIRDAVVACKDRVDRIDSSLDG